MHAALGDSLGRAGPDSPGGPIPGDLVTMKRRLLLAAAGLAALALLSATVLGSVHRQRVQRHAQCLLLAEELSEFHTLELEPTLARPYDPADRTRLMQRWRERGLRDRVVRMVDHLASRGIETKHPATYYLRSKPERAELWIAEGSLDVLVGCQALAARYWAWP